MPIPTFSVVRRTREVLKEQDPSGGGSCRNAEARRRSLCLEVWTKRGIDIDSKILTGHCIRAGLEKKALDLVILDLSEITVFADYFVICSGTSTRQVKAIAEEIEESLSRYKVEPHHIEGESEGRWILMDYGDTVVHVFLEETREYYNLERLWGDAPRLAPEDFETDTPLEMQR